MLSPVLDLIKAAEAYVPHGNHPFFQKLWGTDVAITLQEVLKESEGSDENICEAEEHLSIITDALTLFTREAENPGWIHMTTEQRLVKVKAIQDAPQVPQRSEEWFRQYGEVLTASEFSALFTQTKKRRDLVASKAFPVSTLPTSFRMACPTDEMSALSWGIRFEPVVKQILEKTEGWSVWESGRLTHPTVPRLAASPDGLIAAAVDPSHIGRLIEIKCPYSRTIGKEIPSDYWIQMQIQMEVADIDECEYIEVELLSARAKQLGPVDLSGTTVQGHVYLFKQDVKDGEPFDYKYVYGEIGSTKQPLLSGYTCVETIPWGLKAWHRKLVQRDRVWYTSTVPWQETFWRDVESMKNSKGHAPSSTRACLITDD